MTPITEMLILSWVGRVTGTMSFFSSLSMVYMIFSDRRRRLAKSNHRLMLGLSIFDCFQSAAYAITTMAVPVEYDTYGNMGNSATCAAQGFFIVLGLGVPMYNASLSILYLLTIRHGMSATIFSTKVEPFLHVTSVTVPIAAAFITVFTGAIQPGPTVCFISWESKTIIWIWIGIGIVGSCLCVCIYSMTSICYTVIRQQMKMRSRYSYRLTKPRSTKSTRLTSSTNAETRDTVIQALLYTFSFIITFTFPAITFGYESFFLEVLAKTLYPLQGFWNFLLYIRPGVKKIRREYPDKNILIILLEVIFHAKDRNLRERQKRRNRKDMKEIGASHSPTMQALVPFNNKMRIKTDLNTAMMLSSCSKYHESIKDAISGTILGDEKSPNEGNCLHISGLDIPIDNDSLPWICIPRGQHMENNGSNTSDNSVHANNSASILEPDNMPQISPLYMNDKDLKAETLELNYCLGPLGLQKDRLEASDGSDGSANTWIVGDQLCSPISSESRDVSRNIVDDLPPLDNEENADRCVQRRTSLVNLATINSLYELYPIEILDSMEDV